MPFLDNPRHEIFAKARAKGLMLDDAYELAGFAPGRGHSSRLARRPDVAGRIAELRIALGGWEEITGMAIAGAMLKIAESRDYFDSPQRMRETRLALVEVRKLQRELSEERAIERRAVRGVRETRISAPKTCKKPAKTCPPLALGDGSRRMIGSEVS